MTTQTELSFPPPAPPDERVEELLGFLDGRGWIKARQIKQALGWSDRLTRSLAEESDGRIISGQKGYKLTVQATPEEAAQTAAWYRSQAVKMDNRARRILRTFHRAAS